MLDVKTDGAVEQEQLYPAAWNTSMQKRDI
jgi:hypothetical protein